MANQRLDDMRPGAQYQTKDGPLRVIFRYDRLNVLVHFEHTGYERTARAAMIRKGEVKDPTRPRVYGIGYVGEGQHKTFKGKTPTPQYAAWMSMLRRCYSPTELRRYPSYAGCVVCEEWHNFQNFAAWYDSHYPRHAAPGELHLDKDIRVPGNRTYSPAACQFVTPRENTADSNRRRATQ